MKDGNWGSSFFFIANLLNFVLATAIFTIPFPMYEVGIILGTIVLGIICFISVTACSFIIESLAMKNSINKKEENIHSKAVSFSSSDKKEINSQPETLENEKEIINLANERNEESLLSDKKEDETKDQFYIYKRYEISKLAKLLSKPGYFFVVITIICYLYVGVTSNGIIAGNNLKDIIGRTFNTTLPDYYYYIIVSCFFICVIIIALNNIKHLKKFSMFIMIMRFVIIFLIIGCSFYSMSKYGIAKLTDIPKFNITNITVMIGNSLFVFMSHHSIPGMVENFTPQKRLMKLLIIGYFFSFLLIVCYSYIALFAFSNHDFSCDKNHPFPIAIQSIFSSNFLGIPVIGYIINYYPILNVITSGMQLITLRNNILDSIGGCSLSLSKSLNFSEQKGLIPLLKNFSLNLVIAIPPITIALLLQNIQDLMKYFSSILGFLLMLIVPILVVSQFRSYFFKRKYEFGNLNRSFLKSLKGGKIFISFMSIVTLSLIIYGFIKGNSNKTCVFDE